MNSNIFKTALVGSIEVKNKLVRSATQELMAENGMPTQKMFNMYKELAQGGVGLIITGYFTFSATDNPLPMNVSIASDANIEPLKQLAEVAHKNNTKIVAQLVHLGSQITIQSNAEVYAPSDVTDPYGGISPKALSAEQIKTLIAEFGQAALRAKRANFDGVQIHGAHGYLLSKFLSPEFNRRNDIYGGSPENNARIIVEILNEIKRVCGNEYPVWIKLNSADFSGSPQSMPFENTLTTAQLLCEHGIDCIEVSGGTSSGKLKPARSKRHEAYYFDYAKKLSKHIAASVISVGGFRDLPTIEKALETSNIQAVSLCRALIREPGLPSRWQHNDNSPAQCVACNSCINPNGIACIFKLDEKQREAQKAFLQSRHALNHKFNKQHKNEHI